MLSLTKKADVFNFQDLFVPANPFDSFMINRGSSQTVPLMRDSISVDSYWHAEFAGRTATDF